MKIIITNESKEPIYAQIREQIKEQIVGGDLPAGTVLPSIRKLAKETGVSVITTTRAYNELENEGYIATRQGRGSIVLSTDNDLLREQYLKHIEEGLTTAIETAERLSMTREEFDRMVDALWEEGRT